MKYLLTISLVAVAFTASSGDMFNFRAINDDIIQCAAHYDIKKDKTEEEISAGTSLMQMVVNEHGVEASNTLLSIEIKKIKQRTAEELESLDEKCGWISMRAKKS